MEPTDLTIEILKDIREENRKTNAELGELRTEMRKGLGELRDRQTATEVRQSAWATNGRRAVPLSAVGQRTREHPAPRRGRIVFDGRQPSVMSPDTK
jgi:hypothetical protein